MKKLTLNKKRIIISLAVLVITAAVIFWIYIPLSTRAVNISKEVNQKQMELELIKKKVSRLNTLNKAFEASKRNAAEASKSIPDRLILSEIYYTIDSLAGQSKLKLARVQIGEKKEKFPQVKDTNFIRVNIEGSADYSRIINFLELLPNSALLLEVEKLEFRTVPNKKSSPQISFKITIDAFEYVPGMQS